jgi:hypothetical protein
MLNIQRSLFLALKFGALPSSTDDLPSKRHPTNPLLLTPIITFSSCSAEVKNTGSPVKNFVNRLNKAFESENVLTGSKGLADALNEPTQQTGSDAFGASRKLLSSPNNSKNSVRNALDEAALKIASVGNTLHDETPRALRAAGDDEWTLSTENPVFSETNTPREYNETTSMKNTPAKKQESNVTSPTRSTPRSARTPGSAQKEDASGFPRSFPVKKPAGGYGLQGGLAGWMRKSATLQNNEENVALTTTSEISSDDAGDSRGGGGGNVLFMVLALIVVFGVLFMVPTTSLPSSVAVPLENFRQSAAMSAADTSTSMVALVNKIPHQIPHFTSTNFALSDLRYRAASSYRYLSGQDAVQENQPAQQIAFDAVQTPIKVLGSAVAGVCLAVVMVAAVLQVHGAMPLSALSGILTSFSMNSKGSSSGGGGAAGGFFYNLNTNSYTMDLIEEEQVPRSRRSGSARKNASARSKAPPATPGSTRRLVSDDVDGRVSSFARKAWRRQDTA